MSTKIISWEDDFVLRQLVMYVDFAKWSDTELEYHRAKFALNKYCDVYYNPDKKDGALPMIGFKPTIYEHIKRFVNSLCEDFEFNGQTVYQIWTTSLNK